MKHVTNQSQKQVFLQGAFILMLANIIAKLIGGIFKIPLKNLVGAYCMGIFDSAHTSYAFLLTIATAGISVAISRMVAEANTLGRTEEVRRIFRISIGISLVIGTVITAFMLLSARLLVFANTKAFYSALVLSPALIFGCICAAYRGYHQGMNNMYPTAISQVIEAVVRLLFGYAFAYIATMLGYGEEIVAAAAALGVVFSTLSGTLYMVIHEAVTKTLRKLPKSDAKPKSALSKQLRNIAIPISIASGIMSLTNIIDVYLIPSRLQAIGYTEEGASTLYGIYNTMCVSMMNLPQTLIAAVTVSLIPVIAAAIAQMNTHRSRRTVESAMRLVSLLAFPCAVGIAALTQPILALLFREDVAAAVPLLQVLTIGTVVISFVSITNSILQSMGLERVSLYSMLVGSVIKLTVNYLLIGNPAVGIMGAPIGTVSCYAVMMVINLAVISRNPQVAPRKWGSILKPALAAAVMGAFIILIFPWLSARLGSSAATILLIGVGAFLYFLTMVVIRGFYREDIVMLPKGEKIAKILRLPAEN